MVILIRSQFQHMPRKCFSQPQLDSEQIHQIAMTIWQFSITIPAITAIQSLFIRFQMKPGKPSWLAFVRSRLVIPIIECFLKISNLQSLLLHGLKKIDPYLPSGFSELTSRSKFSKSTLPWENPLFRLGHCLCRNQSSLPEGLLIRRSPRGAGLSMEWKCVASEPWSGPTQGSFSNAWWKCWKNGGETLVDIMVIYH